MPEERATTAFPSNPLWDFSLVVYARPGVAAACLALQERLQADVNLLLFCCWCGHSGRSLGTAEIAALNARVEPWHDHVVRPLRAVRRWLKGAAPQPQAETLRAAVKARELEAERIEQLLLAEGVSLANGPPSPALAAAALTAYLDARGQRASAADAGDLAVLLAASFPGLAVPEARRLLAL